MCLLYLASQGLTSMLKSTLLPPLFLAPPLASSSIAFGSSFPGLIIQV